MTQAMPCCRVMGQMGLERGLSAGAAGKYGEGASWCRCPPSCNAGKILCFLAVASPGNGEVCAGGPNASKPHPSSALWGRQSPSTRKPRGNNEQWASGGWGEIGNKRTAVIKINDVLFQWDFCPKGLHLCLVVGYSWQRCLAPWMAHGTYRCGVITILAWLLSDHFSWMMASIFSVLASSRSPTGTPRSFGFWEGSQLQDSGAHRQCGALGHAPRFVAGLYWVP